MYEYKCKVLSIYDADTMTVEVDLGFFIKHRIKIRLSGIDTPEIRTRNLEEKALAIEARDYVRDLLLDKEVIINTEKTGKYGRYLAIIRYNDININHKLIELGYARVYDGGTRQSWF